MVKSNVSLHSGSAAALRHSLNSTDKTKALSFLALFLLLLNYLALTSR